MLPSAANAFFCLKSGSSNKYFGRTVPFQLRHYPHAAYRLPPIMPQQSPVRYPPGKRASYLPPRSYTWRPLPR